MATSLTTAHISITVYKGDPVDSQEFRHTALFIRFHDRSPTHVVRPPGGFEFQTRRAYDPSQSQNLAKLVPVGFLGVQTDASQLVTALELVAINNRDREFNCQTWVEKVLAGMKDRQLLTQKDYDKGIDGMVDAIAEAQDQAD